PKRALDALIGAGAFDELSPDRARLSAGLDSVLGLANRVSSGAACGQNDFFGAERQNDIRLPQDAVWLPAERLQREHDAIGFYLSGHPLDDFAEALKKRGVATWREFSEKARRGGTAQLAGVVIGRQERRTRSGGRIGVVTLSDPTGQYEGVVFQDTLEACRDRLEPGSCVLLSVTAQERDEGLALRIQTVEPLEKIAAAEDKQVAVYLDRPEPIDALGRLLDEPGRCHVRLIAVGAPTDPQVEVTLSGGRAVSKSLTNAMRALPGVVDVRFH
ncbi:MAG: OB-fold nucleic acid binding domain-containing protein, partial [Pseudomonadota bacterium]